MTSKKTLIIFLTLIFTSLFLFNCEDNPTEPVPDPGRRDYVWQADTIQVPFFYIYRMWGSSPEDVWAVGPGGALSTTIWHYDGESWTTDNISRGVMPRCIWGTDKDNVWIGSSENKIWNYNGTNWSENIKFDVSNGNGISFGDIWGTSENNIYAVGSSGYGENRIATIAHYNGKEWALMEFPEIHYNFVLIRKEDKTSSSYFLLGHSEHKMALFEFDGKALKLIIEKNQTSNSALGFEEINDELFFVIDNTINKYQNGEFTSIIEIESEHFYGRIFGRNKKDIFLSMNNGFAHFNGSEIEYICNFRNDMSSDMIVFDKEIFILSNDLSKDLNIIFRGKYFKN
ncbi:MAG: hypothetical protein JEY94_13800 [Melioribacteraceae bacterium]|nr:hypothetical protein [Melioribacteraceae bacterium]